MGLTITIEKRYFFTFLAVSLIVLGIVGVIAFGTNNPSTFGHSVGEIDWSGTIPQNVIAQGFCIGNSNNCITSWGNGSGGNVVGSGVTSIIAGNGISVSGNTGAVTISATGGGSGSQWITSGNGISFNGGNVGIGVTSPQSTLDILGTFGIGNYANLGEDTYGAGTSLHSGDVDTCDGSDSSQYTCSIAETKSCVDIYNSGNLKRNVNCVQGRSGIRTDSNTFDIEGVGIKIAGSNLYKVTNQYCEGYGALSLNSTCMTRFYYSVATPVYRAPAGSTPTYSWQYFNCSGALGYGNNPSYLSYWTSSLNCPNTKIGG